MPFGANSPTYQLGNIENVCPTREYALSGVCLRMELTVHADIIWTTLTGYDIYRYSTSYVPG